MENKVLERLRSLIRELNMTIKSFGESIQVSEGTMKSMFNRGTNPSLDFLIKIANEYPSFSLRWLLNGEGTMYKDSAKETEYKTEEKLNIASDSNPEYGKDEFREKYYKKLEEENELLKKALQMHEKTIEDKNELIEMYKTGQIVVVGSNSPKGIHK